MAESLGRRETNKIATKRALQESGERLFAERGFDKTTVRDIAEGAGVTERTFFRYFSAKEELIVDELLAWVPVLQSRIRARPPGEDPLTAVKEALLGMGKRMATTSSQTPMWLFSEGPVVGRLPRSGPTVLLKVEDALSEVIGERIDATSRADAPYTADILARTSLALIRSALIRDWQLRMANQRPRPSLAALIDRAFSTVQPN